MIFFRNKFHGVWILMLFLSACNTMPEKTMTQQYSYEQYDERVQGLKDSVARGDLSVTEAEAMRQEAFREYLEAVRERQIELEYRNY